MQDLQERYLENKLYVINELLDDSKELNVNWLYTVLVAINEVRKERGKVMERKEFENLYDAFIRLDESFKRLDDAFVRLEEAFYDSRVTKENNRQYLESIEDINALF